MSFAYFDTSVVVKRYIRESGSLRVRALLRQHDFLSSAITPVEVMSALCRRKQGGDLSEENFPKLLHRFQNDRMQLELVEAGAMVLSRAEEILQGPVSLRALDAIHIASFVTFHATSGIRIPFITSDSRQREGAERMGLDVIWVG